MSMQQWVGLGLQASIVLTLVGFGLTATMRDATYLFRHPPLLLRAVLAMNIVMPAIAAVVGMLTDLPWEVKVALVALAVSPVPPIVQKKQVTAGGRMEYVVGLLFAMAVLSIVLVPLSISILAHIFDRPASVAPAGVVKAVLSTVVIPLFIALAIRHFFPAAEKASGAVMACAGILLVVTAGILIYALWPIVMRFIGNGTVLVFVVMAAVGLAVGHVLGGPLGSDRTVLAMSTASRHPAVAMAAAMSTSSVEAKPELAVILLYLVVATLVSIPYQRWRSRAGDGGADLGATLRPGRGQGDYRG